MRERMEKEKTGWKLVTTAKHCDRVNWDLLIEWCHSDAASTVDNDNKQEIKVHSTSLKDGAKVVEYALHDRRYFNDTIENLCPEFKRSSQFGQMKDAQRSYHEKKRRTRAEYLAWKEKRELLGMEIRGALFRKWKSDTTAGEGAGDNAVTLSEDDIDEKVGVVFVFPYLSSVKPNGRSRFALSCTSELSELREMNERPELAVCLRGQPFGLFYWLWI